MFDTYESRLLLTVVVAIGIIVGICSIFGIIPLLLGFSILISPALLFSVGAYFSRKFTYRFLYLNLNLASIAYTGCVIFLLFSFFTRTQKDALDGLVFFIMPFVAIITSFVAFVIGSLLYYFVSDWLSAVKEREFSQISYLALKTSLSGIGLYYLFLLVIALIRGLPTGAA